MKMFDNTYSYEDNAKIIFLVIDRQSHFVTFATDDFGIAQDEMKANQIEYPGHEFAIVCYPMDMDEVIYLLKSVHDQ